MEKENRYFEAVGRRKTSVARSRLFIGSGDGKIEVNGQDVKDYFKTLDLVNITEDALRAAGFSKGYSVSAKVSGGGIHSQAEALRHSLSRALIKVDADLRPRLKKEGYLRRDPRVKERRKFGLKKARKAPQWAKR